MASDDSVNRDSCIYDPNFAIVCSFFEKFSSLCGIKHPAFSDLQEMLDSTDEVSPELIDLHIRLMRKAKKNVNPDRWQRTLAKFCYYYSPQDSWALEQHGYEHLDYNQRLRILLCACEAQFDQNIKFKNDVNKLPIDELRLSPIGKDKDGVKYWIQTDEKLHLKVYKENPEDETFDLIATDRDELLKLIETLKTECHPDRKYEEPIEEEEEDDDEEQEEEEEEEEAEEEAEEEEEEEEIEDQSDIKNEPNQDATHLPVNSRSEIPNQMIKNESHSQESASSTSSRVQSDEKSLQVKEVEVTKPQPTPKCDATLDTSSKPKKHVDVKTKRFDKPPEIVLKKEKVVDKTPKVIKAEEFAQHIEKLKSEKILLPLLNSPLPFHEPVKGNGNESLKTKINMKFNMIKPVLQNEVLLSKIEEVKNNKDLYKKMVVKRDDNPINNYVMQINKSKEAAAKIGKPGLKLEQILKSKLAQKLAAHEPSAVSKPQVSKEPDSKIESSNLATPTGPDVKPNQPSSSSTKRKLSAVPDSEEAKKLKLAETVSTGPIDQVRPSEDDEREIEEPLMLVTGVGNGKECQSGNPDRIYESDDSDDEREFSLVITGTGTGAECDTGNNETEDNDKEKHATLTHKVDDILSKNEPDTEQGSASTSNDDLSKKPEEGEKKKPKLWTIDAICNSDSKETPKKDDISCFPNYSFNKDKKPETAPYREYSFFGMAGESKENDVIATNFYFGCDTQNPPFVADVRNATSFKEKKTHNVKDIVQLDGEKEKNDVNYASFANSTQPEEAFNLCTREKSTSQSSPKQNNSEAINYSKPSSDNVYSNVTNLPPATVASSETNQNDSKPANGQPPVTNSFASLVPYDDDEDDEDDNDHQTNDKLVQPDNQTKTDTAENETEEQAEPIDKNLAQDLSRNDRTDKPTESSYESSKPLSPVELVQPETLPVEPPSNEIKQPSTGVIFSPAKDIIADQPVEKEAPKNDLTATIVQPEEPANELVHEKIDEPIEKIEQPIVPEDPSDPGEATKPTDTVQPDIKEENLPAEPQPLVEPVENLQPVDPPKTKVIADLESAPSEESSKLEIKPETPASAEELDSQSQPRGMANENQVQNIAEPVPEDSTKSEIKPEIEVVEKPSSEYEKHQPIDEPSQPEEPIVQESITELESPIEKSQEVEPEIEKHPEIPQPLEPKSEEIPLSEPATDLSTTKVEDAPVVETASSTIKVEDAPLVEPAPSTIKVEDAPSVETAPSDIIPESLVVAPEPEPTQSKLETDSIGKPPIDDNETSNEEKPEITATEIKDTVNVPSTQEPEQTKIAERADLEDEAPEQNDEQKAPIEENVFSDDDTGAADAPRSPDQSSEDDNEKTNESIAKTEDSEKPESTDKIGVEETAEKSPDTPEPKITDKKTKKGKPSEDSTPALTLRSSARVARSAKKEDLTPKKAAKKPPKEAKPAEPAKQSAKKIKTKNQPVAKSEDENEPVKSAKKTPRGRKKTVKASKSPAKSTPPKTESEASSDENESNDEAESKNQQVKPAIKLNIKKIVKKSEDEEQENQAKVDTENDKKSEKAAKTASAKKRTPKRGWLNEIDVSNITPVDGSGTGIRQSRRIAQLKIKEQAEGKYVDQITPTKKTPKADSKSKQQPVSAKKNNKTSAKKSLKSKITKEESDGEDSNYEKSSSKKKRKKKDPKKKLKMGNMWKAGSDSSTEEDAEEEDHFEDEEEDEEIAINDASDHEFSPESDLEDEDFQPVKRARTAHSKPKTEDKTEKDDLCCQKCRTAEQPEWILLCDKCDEGWHAACLRPPSMTIPEGDWYCPPCQHNMLISSLHKFLKSYDKDVKKRDNEVLRKKRLEYVGISFSNIISEQQKADKTDIKVKKEEERFVKYEISEDDNSEDESEEEPLYTLRVRRQANVSYRLNEYDELMNSAIQTEANGETVEGAERNIASEAIPKPEETQIPEKQIEPEESEKPEEKDENDESSDDDDDEEDEEEKPKEEKVSPMILQLRTIRKKPARLTKLDVSSEDDHYSDEDFKGTSGEDYDDDEYAKSETDSDEARYRKSKRGPVRRSTRARVTRYDNDFINDDDSEEDDYEPKKKKKRSRNSDSNSEDEDSTWGKRKRTKYSRAHRSLPSKKRRKRIRFDGDSDEDKKERKEKKGKKSRVTYGLEESEDDHPQRRTRGKKINYLENLGTDSDEDNANSASKSKKVLSDDDDYVNEDDEPEMEAENEVNENGDKSEFNANAASKKARRKEQKSNEIGSSASNLHEMIAANNTSVIRTYSKNTNAAKLEPVVSETGIDPDPNGVSASDAINMESSSPKRDLQMYGGAIKGDNKLALKPVDATNASLEGMQSMAQSIPQMISSPSNYSMVRKMMPPMAGDGPPFPPNMGGPPLPGNLPSYSEVGVVYEGVEGPIGGDGDKYTHPLRVVSPTKLYGQDGQQMPPAMMGRPGPPFMMGPGMPPRPLPPGMPPNMMQRGPMPMPPGMHLRGPPPPNAMLPHGLPPNAMPPNAMPMNAMPPNAMPMNAMPPNVMPMNAMPPSRMPPNAVPPNAMPPNTMPPNAMPPMNQAPIAAPNMVVPVSLNSILEPPGDSPKRRARGRGKKQLEIERLKRETTNPTRGEDEMMPLHMLKPLPSDMNAIRPPPPSSFNSPSPPTSFANHPNMPRLPYPPAGPPPSSAQPPSTQSAVTVNVGNPSKRVKITPTRMRQPNPAQNVMRFQRPPSSMIHGAGQLPLDPSPSGGNAVPVNSGDTAVPPPSSQPPPNGTPPRTEAGIKKEPMDQYYQQPTSYAPASQVPRAFNQRPEFPFAQKPLPPGMYQQPIPSTGAPHTVISRPPTVTTSTVITGPISSQGPLPAGVSKPETQVSATPPRASYSPAPYAMNAPPPTISSPTSKPSSATPPSTPPTSAYQALHIKQLPTAPSSAPATPYNAPPYYAASPLVPSAYPPPSQPSLPPPSFARGVPAAQPSFVKSPQPLSTASPTVPYNAADDTTSTTSSEYAPPPAGGAAPSDDAGFQFQECNTAVTSSNEPDTGGQFQAAGYDEENNAAEDQPSGEFGGLVSYFSSQREDDLDG